MIKIVHHKSRYLPILFCLQAHTNTKVSFAEGIHALTLPLYTHILHNSSILLSQDTRLPFRAWTLPCIILAETRRFLRTEFRMYRSVFGVISLGRPDLGKKQPSVCLI